MTEHKGSNPKKILAVQMLMIGIVLLVLGIMVSLLSPLKAMTPVVRTWSLLSNASIILTGLAFTIGGLVRNKKLKQG
jgi:Na+/phosphate symporter